MSKPNQMFTHELNGLKGFSPGMPWVVDKKLDIDSAATQSNFLAGRLAYVAQDTNNSSKIVWKQGTALLDNTSNYNAPLYYVLFQNYNDFDVVGDDGNVVGAAAGVTSVLGGSQAGGIMGVCVAQCAEIETTEYTAGTYVPGDLLISGSTGSWTKWGGTTKQVICGVVSQGIVGNSIQLNQATTGPGPNLLRLVTVWTFAKTA